MAIHSLVAVVLWFYCFKAATQWGTLQAECFNQTACSRLGWPAMSIDTEMPLSKLLPHREHRDKQTLKTATHTHTHSERLHLHMFMSVKWTSSLTAAEWTVE